jgi:hypothetical protein
MEGVSFESLRWLLLITITLHNLEEARWLPAWSQHAGRFQHPVSRWEFGVAVTGVTLLAYLIGVWSMAAGPHSIGTLLLCAYAAVMLLNAFVPHLAVTLLLQRYAPGLATGLLLNVPVCGLLIWHALASAYVSWGGLLLATVGLAALLLALIPRLFAVGRAFESRESRFWSKPGKRA